MGWKEWHKDRWTDEQTDRQTWPLRSVQLSLNTRTCSVWTAPDSCYCVPCWKSVLVSGGCCWQIWWNGGFSTTQVSSLTSFSNVNEHFSINNTILSEKDASVACFLTRYTAKTLFIQTLHLFNSSLIKYNIPFSHDKLLFVVWLGERPL